MIADADVRVDADGSLVLFTPLTDAGRAWIDEHTETEPWQWLGPALCVEHRYAADLVHGMRNDGLKVSTAHCWFESGKRRGRL